MKKVVKLNESDLTKLVRKIIKENLINEGIRAYRDFTELVRMGGFSSSEYYITIDTEPFVLKFTSTKNPSGIFYMGDNDCAGSAKVVDYAVNLFYSEANKELPSDQLQPFAKNIVKTVDQYAKRNSLIQFKDLYNNIKAINNPKVIYKVSFFENNPSSLSNMMSMGNFKDVLSNEQQHYLIEHYFKNTMMQVVGNGKTYKVYSLCYKSHSLE